MNTTLRKFIIQIMKDSNSVKNVISHFENESLFKEYRETEENIAYRIPINIWENLTDISRECIDFLPPTMDGSVHFDQVHDLVLIYKD